MNPLVRAQINELARGLDALRDLLRETRSRLQDEQQAREQATKERWRYQRRASALEHSQSEFDELLAENARMRRERDQLREALERILAHTKALGDALRR